MRITLFLLIVVMVLPSCRHKAPADRITQFDWLEGEWVNDAEFPLITREIWHRTDMGMAGIGYTVENGDTIFFENMEIKKSGNNIVYIPTIGNSETNKPFKLISDDNAEFVFENNENDFPQRIYYRQAEDSLYAWIEGTKNGKTLRMDFPYKRKKTAEIPSD